MDSRRHEVNDLNVFPVADGDTGDNMAMTMRAVLAELDRINGQMIDEIGRDELVTAVARAALLGARGNSGVILSQIVRGAAEELASRPGELIDPILVSAAFARAADAAYESVREPAEGTMLTAVRAMAHRVAQDLAHMEPQRLGDGVAPEDQDRLLAEVLERALEAGNEAVRRGPEQLAVLREAGVVDAGAYGLTVIVAGMIAALRGDEAAPELEHHTAPAHDLHLPQHEDSRYRYCTNFVVTGEALDSQGAVPLLEEIGDSVLVVGDPRTLKVHVHTDDPDGAVGIFTNGEVSRLDVADMREQVAERAARLSGGADTATAVAMCGAVVVASGAGMVEMYRGLGAHVVDGGATLNPSTYDILAGIHAVPAAEAIVLPNSPNVILAAERAAELSGEAGAGRAHARPAGRPRRAARVRPRRRGRRQRRRGGRGRRGGGHRWRGPRRPRRRVRPLLRGRRRGLRRRGADRLGHARGRAAAGARGGVRRRRGGHVRGRRGRAARRGRRRGARAGRRRARPPRGRPAVLVVAAGRRGSDGQVTVPIITACLQ